ncbi:hypothetical protein SeLEV6574_g02585 [Synchytrium endobioticum]|uniref:Uncharacterized protein n=1 Tax=Synchytrium endobioticum TaxID=286115 RepID=A0A507D7V9_9FUNG|nr:hypothetical protein SeLEV6574_g02585 [Synchytrium endobioticum]
MHTILLHRYNNPRKADELLEYVAVVLGDSDATIVLAKYHYDQVLDESSPIITFIKFFVSPTGDFAVIAGTDQILRIFDLSTGLVVSKGVGQSDTFGQRIACRFTVRRFASLTSPKMHLGVITEASRLQVS